MGELNKMETKPMLPLIVTMSVPPLISMFLQYTYNFVDCMFVSWISEDALTAVSLAFPITTLMIAMSIGTGVGVNVLIARYLGQKNQDMANSVVSNGIILSAACGVIVTISPGATSRTNSAPTVSKAQLSDEKKYALSRLPMQSGWNPNGSLAPIILRGLATTSEYAPRIFCIANFTASSTVPTCNLSRAIK